VKKELLQAKKARGPSLLVGHEVDSVAEEDGIGGGRHLGQRLRVAPHEAHVAPRQALARHVNRLERRLDADHSSRPPAALQLVQNQLGNSARPRSQLHHPYLLARRAVGIQPLDSGAHERLVDVVVELMARERIEGVCASDGRCCCHGEALALCALSPRRQDGDWDALYVKGLEPAAPRNVS
jgi:hypothetical protein